MSNSQCLDKSIIKIMPVSADDEKQYWAGKTPEERLLALELNRQIIYGYTNDDPPRLQRFFEIVKQPWS